MMKVNKPYKFKEVVTKIRQFYHDWPEMILVKDTNNNYWLRMDTGDSKYYQVNKKMICQIDDEGVNIIKYLNKPKDWVEYLKNWRGYVYWEYNPLEGSSEWEVKYYKQDSPYILDDYYLSIHETGLVEDHE